MAGLASLAFANPWLLLALIGLPALWFLLRVTPPAPRIQSFPAIRLLLGLEPPEETPARTPWWLLLLRLLAAALLIVGLSGPVLYPAGQLGGSGPLILTVDDGWAAGKNWSARQQAAEALIDRAERENRRVRILTTAPARADAPLAPSDLLRPDVARERIRALEPKPWPVDYQAAAVAAEMQVTGSAHVVWLSDGLAGDGADTLANRLQRLGRLEVLQPSTGNTAFTVLPPDSSGTMLEVPVRRAETRAAVSRTVVATDARGRLVGTAEAAFDAGADETFARFELPLELRNRIAQVSVEGERHAAATALLDSRWQRRPVGLISASALADAQPLLSEIYYLDRALAPYAEVSRGSLQDLLQRDLAVITVPDRGALPANLRQQTAAWVERGGVILRFAGPRLADDLTGPEASQGPSQPILPVALRHGGRALGGAMSWDSPATLAPFPSSSPFAGLDIPADLEVEQQVLAQPSLDLGEKTWARLTDGTPLVTAEQRGDGWIVLVHTTANTSWSNLPLSGLFVQMLRRVVSVGQGVSGASSDQPALPPYRVLDGFGQLAQPDAQVKAIPPEVLSEHQVSPTHPPGLYGRDGGRRAHNLGPAVSELAVLSNLPPGVAVGGYGTEPERRFGPWLLAAGLVLLLIDLLLALLLRGLLDKPLARGGAMAAVVLLILLLPQGANAQADTRAENYALRATLETHLAYVETGVPRVDRVTEQGLQGLTRILTERTAVEPGEPMAVDLNQHDPALFPFLYWSVTPDQRSLTSTARRKINDYLRSGGTILFDLREAQTGSLFGETSQGTQALQRLTDGIDIPPLRPVPAEHVLTKAFYLLSEFPGRYSGGQLWVEDTSDASGDGVASVLVANNDYVGAWAIDDIGRPRFAVTPGGEDQREMSYRTGVNIVMYALTGNYKADQVHVPAILERLGQ